MASRQINKQKEIQWNIINSALAGGLVLFGSLSNGEFTIQGICAAFVAGCIVALTKFKDYWAKIETKKGMFNLI